jgi:hypothetical protein
LTQKIKVLTEKQANDQGVPCGYNPDVVVSLSLRVSNVLYSEMKEHAENQGYSSLAEYIKSSVRKQILNERKESEESALRIRQSMPS